MKNFKNLTRRGLAVFLALVMCLSLMQVTAFAGEDEETQDPAANDQVSDAQTEKTSASEEEESTGQTDTSDLKDEESADQQVTSAPKEEESAVQEDASASQKEEANDSDEDAQDNGIAALSEEEEEETAEPEKGIEISYDSESRTFTINGEGTLNWKDHNFGNYKGWENTEILNVTGVELCAQAFSSFKNLKSVTLTDVTVPDNAYPFYGAGSSDGMKISVNGGSLGKYTSWGCNTLTEITVSGSKIGAYAFCSCESLMNATVINSDIGDHAFDSCSKLSTTTLTSVSSIGTYAFVKCNLTELTLDGVQEIGELAFALNSQLSKVTISNVLSTGRRAFHGCTSLKNVEISDSETVDYRSFYGCTALETVTIENVDNVGWLAFQSCTALRDVTLTGVKSLEGGAFQDCAGLSTVRVDEETHLGYLNSGVVLTNVIPGIVERVQAILDGKFALDPAAEIAELSPDQGWDDSKTAKSNNWNTYDNGTQLVAQARWTNPDKTEAEVKVDAYYTAPKQMDYIFVVDLSNSMTLLGNPNDMNARFYDMQSKLLDVTSKLLNTEGYDCRVAFATFGLTTSNTYGFFSEEAAAHTAINSLTPYYENTNYGLGLQGAQELLKSQEAGRETTVVFISDGQPRDGKDNTTEDLTGSTAAAAIKEQGVEIYGVLQSVPEDEHEGAVAALKNVCSDTLFFESTDTDSFSKAVNAAIAAPHGSYTVTIPVNPAFENVTGLTVSTSAGTAAYDANSHTITWAINGMPFTKHTLTYKMSLTQENAEKTGDQNYPVNDGSASIPDSVSVPSPELKRTVSEEPTTYTLTVKYVYADGTQAAADYTASYAEGAPYSVNSPAITNYQPDQAVVSGTMPAENVTVTVTYRSTGGGGGGGGGGTTTIPDRNPPTSETPGTIIEDPDVPLAAPGLNSVDHYAYIIGYPDGTVRPQGNITRAEVATIFFRLMTDEFRTTNWAVTNSFPDVASASLWYNNAVSTAAKAGLLKGREDGKFYPQANITRAEFAAIAARFLSDEEVTAQPFPDTVGHWAEQDIIRAVQAGWIKGNSDGTFRPNDPITRAEAMTLVNRMLDRVPDQDHMLSDMVTWPDNPSSAWYYEAVQEATNSHDYERDELGITESWTAMLANRDWAALETEWANAASGSNGSGDVAENLNK